MGMVHAAHGPHVGVLQPPFSCCCIHARHLDGRTGWTLRLKYLRGCNAANLTQTAKSQTSMLIRKFRGCTHIQSQEGRCLRHMARMAWLGVSCM